MQMCLKIDENNIIKSYSVIGKIEGGIDIETETNYNIENIPLDLCAGYYKLIDGNIVLDEELKALLITQ